MIEAHEIRNGRCRNEIMTNVRCTLDSIVIHSCFIMQFEFFESR